MLIQISKLSNYKFPIGQLDANTILKINSNTELACGDITRITKLIYNDVTKHTLLVKYA